MAAPFSFKAQGLDKLAKFWKQLPNEIKDKEVQTALKWQGNLVGRAIKQEIGTHTGNLKKSVGVRAGKRKVDVIDVWIGVQNRKRKASHWHLYAFGTEERMINSYKTSPSVRARLKTNEAGQMGIILKMSNGYAFVTSTGKMPAHEPVTKVANNMGQVTANRTAKQINTYIGKRIERMTAKYGL